LRLTVTLY